MTIDTDFAEELTTALAALNIETDLVRVAWAEIHQELRIANVYGTLLCCSGSCRMAGGTKRGAIRVYGYAPDLRAVPLGDCGQHTPDEVAHQIAFLIDSGRRDAESRATHPEAWAHETTPLWVGYQWKPLDTLARM